MGQAVASALGNDSKAELAGIWQRGEPLADIVAGSNVLVDFSLPDALAEVIAAVGDHDKPLVCGVSGLDESQMAALKSLSASVPIVFDRNMSQGIAVLQSIAKSVAASLGGEYSVEIHETHHVHKLDSPSGTALKLADAVAAGQGIDAGTAKVEFKVERRGEVPGDHSVIWSSPMETVTLAHSVTTRDVFAAGALRAAHWVVAQQPGLYSMHDVLFSDA